MSKAMTPKAQLDVLIQIAADDRQREIWLDALMHTEPQSTIYHERSRSRIDCGIRVERLELAAHKLGLISNQRDFRPMVDQYLRIRQQRMEKETGNE